MRGLIESNLDLCGISEGKAEVVQSEVEEFLRRGLKKETRERWDIVFYDPPYASDYAAVLESIGGQRGALLTEDGLVIVEHHHKKALPEEIGHLRRRRTLKQGDSTLSFYEAVNRMPSI